MPTRPISAASSLPAMLEFSMWLAPIVDEGKPSGFFLTGQFQWQVKDAREDFGAPDC